MMRKIAKIKLGSHLYIVFITVSQKLDSFFYFKVFWAFFWTTFQLELDFSLVRACEMSESYTTN